MTFRARMKVRFGDEDHAGIVYYPRFFHFFHVAFEDFFDQQGFPYRQVLDVDHVGWPAVKVECDFRAPLRFGDEVDVDVDLTRVGNKSATFRYRAQRAGEEVAVAHVTVACVDMRTFAPQPIPDAYRALFDRHRVAEGQSPKG